MTKDTQGVTEEDTVRTALELLVNYCAKRGFDTETVSAAYLEEARAALATPAPQVPTWQPIETAPSDGREMFVVKAFQVCNGFTGDREYTSDPWCVWRQGDGFARWPHHFAPTHWMHLPAAPQTKEPS